MATLQKKRVPKRSDGTWQAEKSQLTRNQILDATMRCLAEIGYAQTTTEKIAKRAGVSRGAMTHHFKSRDEVFAAAARYITDLRATEYDDAIKDVNLPLGEPPTLESMHETLRALQKFFTYPSFFALQELLRGARTDKMLQRTMSALEKSLDKKIYSSLISRFPVWAEMSQSTEVLRDLILFSLEGVALAPSSYLKGDRLQRLLEFLSTSAVAEFDKAYIELHGEKALKRVRAVQAKAHQAVER